MELINMYAISHKADHHHDESNLFNIWHHDEKQLQIFKDPHQNIIFCKELINICKKKKLTDESGLFTIITKSSLDF